MDRKILWLPILGSLYFGIRIIKYKIIEIDFVEFILYMLYQTVCITLLIEIIKNNIKC